MASGEGFRSASVPAVDGRGAAALELIDGNRVHDAAGHDCLIVYGARWRGAATRALAAMDLQPSEMPSSSAAKG
jgi:hypothetical protein